MEPGKYDVSEQVPSSSAVAFEWGLGCATGSCTEVVTPLCKDVVRRGVPAPQFVGNVQGGQIDAAELRRVASEAGTDDKDELRKKFGPDVVRAECSYVGVEGKTVSASSSPAASSCSVTSASSGSMVAFQWTLRTQAGSELHTVTVKCLNALQRGVPLPARTSRIAAAEFERRAADASLSKEASQKHYGPDVAKAECRYLGVAKEDGSADLSALATPESQLSFEWVLQTCDSSEVYPVSVKCKKALKGQQLTPPHRPKPVKDILEAAGGSAKKNQGLLADKLKLKVEDLEVLCEYLGVKVGNGEPDVDKPAFSEDMLEFKWTLRTQNWEWVDSVSMRCKHLPQGVPLPRCTVTIDVLGHAAW